MKTIWVLVEDNGTSVNAVLAVEALRKAAEKNGDTVVCITTKNGAVPTLPSTPADQDICILVGGVQAQGALASLSQINTNLEEILQNPESVLKKTCSSPCNDGASSIPNIVAITSCPTGIAHTFMAAEGLEQGAQALGYKIKVETQGSVGADNKLTTEEIARADVVIIAADREVDRERFSGKRVYASGTKQAITNGQEYIKKALQEATLQSGEASSAQGASGNEQKAGPYKHLMNGVSFMLPFVVAGGLLIAVAFALGGIYAGNEKGTLANILMTLGGQGGFALMVPVLSGYIAFSIADRPGLAPGMIGGMMCGILNAGFIGGIISGFIAGYGTMYINKYTPLPKNLAGLKPVLILPLLGTLLTGLIMFYVVGTPAAQLNEFLKSWLSGLQGTSSILFGLILGGMMSVDLGGPVNKAAYAFSTLLLQSNNGLPMAAVMGAGMTAPLGVALATKIFKSRFSPDEREAGNAAFVLGLSFVSEGAIPFAAKDPFRVIPSFIIGSAVTGAISMFFGVSLAVPHGGIFVLPIPGAVTGLSYYIAAIVIGTVVTSVLLGLLKKPYTAE